MPNEQRVCDEARSRNDFCDYTQRVSGFAAESPDFVSSHCGSVKPVDD
jgi:hypothetical protein